MLSASRALSNRAIISKLEVERKFIPSPLLKKYASETATLPRIHVAPAADHSPNVVLTRLPRKRITDKYFDHKGRLEQKGIWVRWRKEQTITHDNANIIASHTCWEAKVKQGGNFLESQFIEAKGRDAVEDLMAETGVCRSIYGLSFQLGFVADRVGWAVEGYDGQKDGEDATMSLVLDTMTAALEGRNGEYSTFMNHQVGELELEKAITTNLEDEDGVRSIDESAMRSHHRATCASQAEAMREQLTTFMLTYPSLLEADGSPVGKITAYMERKHALAERLETTHAANKLVKTSEVQYERLMGAFKSKCKC
ncbi:hypothetical protein Q7P35_003654 [Cladosporium inversicolor]